MAVHISPKVSMTAIVYDMGMLIVPQVYVANRFEAISV